MNNEKKKILFTIVCMVVGSFIAALNIRTLVRGAGVFPGGFTGVTILIQRIFNQYLNIEIPFFVLNTSLNVIPAVIAYKYVGKKFTLYSIGAIVFTSLFVDILPFAPLKQETMLLSLFGGIVNGISILILLKGKLSSGGTDFLAMAASNKWNITTWNYVLLFNAVIILISGLLFNWSIALYSIIFQFCSIQVINMFHARYKKVCLFIISEKTNELSEALLSDVHHGVTKFDGVGCYSNTKKSMLYTVVSEEQLKPALRIIRKIDSCAFVNAVKTEQMNGLFYLDPFD